MDNRKRKINENIDINENKRKKIFKNFKPSIDVKNVKTLNELIILGNDWDKFKTDMDQHKDYIMKSKYFRKKYYTIIDRYYDFKKLYDITEELKMIDDLIGMNALKEQLVDQILFFVQGLHKNEMMHTVIKGVQGCGKTTIARILGKIYTKLGFLSKGTFKIAGRSDFIGQYLGTTSNKTIKLLESCKGGVLFIDEAYSLGNKEKRDSYAKEAIDTLNQFLSENTEDFICIIAGYEKELNECFFNWNPGLERRFPWKFKLDNYSVKELRDIFLYQIKTNNWNYEDDIPNVVLNLVDKHKNIFTENGGDCLILFDKCKISHSKRVFGTHDSKFILNRDDIINGIDKFVKLKDHSSSDKFNKFNSSLYI